jgi:hypothetical protein
VGDCRLGQLWPIIRLRRESKQAPYGSLACSGSPPVRAGFDAWAVLLKSAFEIPLPLNEEMDLAAVSNYHDKMAPFCAGALLDQHTGFSEDAERMQIWL